MFHPVHSKKFSLLLFFCFLSRFVSAHPLDISITTMELHDTAIYASVYLHPYEISLLVRDSGKAMESISFEELKGIVMPYFQKRYSLYGPSGKIPLSNAELEQKGLADILANGLYINYSVPVRDPDRPLTIKTDLFIEYFSTQSNKIVLLNENGEPFPNWNEIILTTKKQEWSFVPSAPDFSSFSDDSTDSDGDELTDFMESLYGLDPHSEDTDGDGFLDSTEFLVGWDPLNPELTDKQKEFLKSLSEHQEIQEKSIRPDNPGIKEEAARTGALQEKEVPLKNVVRENNPAVKGLKNNAFLEKTLTLLDGTFTGNKGFGGFLLLMLFIFILGFLHASMPGHGKGILIAYLAEGNRRFRHALLFITSFTVTHLIDVIILALILSLFKNINSSEKLTTILQVIGGAGLLGISFYVLIRGILMAIGWIEVKSDKEEAAGLKKGMIILGFLTGLAPCPYGWYLLLMLQALGRLDMVPLVILIFGLGIFLFLLSVACASLFIKNRAYKLFDGLTRYSALISGTMMLAFSLIFFFSRLRFLF